MSLILASSSSSLVAAVAGIDLIPFRISAAAFKRGWGGVKSAPAGAPSALSW